MVEQVRAALAPEPQEAPRVPVAFGGPTLAFPPSATGALGPAPPPLRPVPAGRAAGAAAATTQHNTPLHSAVFGAAVAGGSAAHQHHRPGSSQTPAAPPQLLPLKTPNTSSSFPSEAAVRLPALTATHGCHGMCWVIV